MQDLGFVILTVNTLVRNAIHLKGCMKAVTVKAPITT
jgi:hypothetical protein